MTRRAPQAFVSGTWRPEKAAPYTDEAMLLGRSLADAGFDLACGPGTGLARLVTDGYRSAPTRGFVRYYLPRRELMEAVGEVVEEGADDVVETELDYPMRNVFQVQQSSGVFCLTGGDGALEELLPAVIDYRLPVAIVEDAGSAARAMKLLLDIWPEWGELVRFGPSVADLLAWFIESVGARARVDATP